MDRDAEDLLGEGAPGLGDALLLCSATSDVWTPCRRSIDHSWVQAQPTQPAT